MKRFGLFFGFLLCLLLAGCANSQQESVPSTSTTDSTQQPAQAADAPAALVKGSQNSMQLTLYYPSEDAIHLIPEVRSFPINDTPARTAVEALLSGTSQPQRAKVFPQGTKLRQLTVKDDIAYVDFNGSILKGNGGSATEILLVTSVVNTLTEFPKIEKVQFLVEGKKIDTLYGHMDLTEPLSRSPGLIKKP